MTIVNGKSLTTADGRVVRTMQCGDLDGLPVLAFHPTPSCCRFVRIHAAAAMAEGIRLIGFSRPGYGGSTPTSPPSLEVVAQDSAAVADLYRVERFAVVGVSGGTPFAAAAAATLADRVAALALCAPLAPPRELADPGEAWDEAEFPLHRLAESGDLAGAVAGLKALGADDYTDLLGGDDESLARAFLSQIPEPDRGLIDFTHAMGIAIVLRDALEDDDEQPCFEGFAFDSLAAATGAVGLGRITAPTQIWAGERDVVTPLENAQWYADRIPGAQLTVVPGGHFSPFAGRSADVFRELRAAALN